MKRSFLIRVGAWLLLCGLLLALGGCAATRTVRPSGNANKVVATAGDVEILYDELYYLAMSRIAELKEQHGEQALSDPAVAAELKSFVEENLLTRNHALVLVAKDFGIEIDKGELGEKVDERIEQILTETFEGDRDAYIESLNGSYLTDRYVRNHIATEELMASFVITEMLERGSLDGSEAAAMEFLRGDDVARVYQVLIERRNYVSAEAALQKATELRARVAAETEDAARVDEMRLAIQFSTYVDDGNGLYFARGEMEKAFEDAAFALPLYGVSEVLEVEGGYSFVMRLPKDEAYMSDHIDALYQKAYYVTLNKMVDEKLATMTLSMTEYGSELDLTNLPAIDADGGETAYTVVGICACALLVGGIGALVYFLMRRNGGKYAKNSKNSHR